MSFINSFGGMVLAEQMCFVPTDLNCGVISCLWDASTWAALFPERSERIVAVYGA